MGLCPPDGRRSVSQRSLYSDLHRIASLLHDAGGTCASMLYVAIAAAALTVVLMIATPKPLRAAHLGWG